MSLDAGQARGLVIDTLARLKESPHKPFREKCARPEAVNLVLGTMAQESQLRWIRQAPTGPARGLVQMEPDTLIDLWVNFLSQALQMERFSDPFFRATGLNILTTLGTNQGESDSARKERLGYLLMGNVHLAIVACRLHYWRAFPPLPTTLEGAAQYWKNEYNSGLGADNTIGAGKPEDFVANYTRILGAWEV